MLPSDPASRRRPRASLVLRHYQAGQDTFPRAAEHARHTIKKAARNAANDGLFKDCCNAHPVEGYAFFIIPHGPCYLTSFSVYF